MSKPLAEYIPVKARRAIYSLLATAFALEAIWDVVPSGWESRLAASLAVLGFGLAQANAT